MLRDVVVPLLLNFLDETSAPTLRQQTMTIISMLRCTSLFKKLTFPVNNEQWTLAIYHENTFRSRACREHFFCCRSYKPSEVRSQRITKICLFCPVWMCLEIASLCTDTYAVEAWNRCGRNWGKHRFPKELSLVVASGHVLAHGWCKSFQVRESAFKFCSFRRAVSVFLLQIRVVAVKVLSSEADGVSFSIFFFFKSTEFRLCGPCLDKSLRPEVSSNVKGTISFPTEKYRDISHYSA